METAKFKVGDILVDKKTSTRYRIIFVSGTQVIVCQMDCNKLNLLDFDIAIIESLLDTLDLTIANEEAPVYDTRKLPLSVKERFDFYSSVIKKVSATYGPDYLALGSKVPKPELEEILSESKMARATLWKIIRVYLQSGFNLYSLIDKRTDSGRKEWKYEKKPGRKTSYGLSFGTVIDERTKEEFKEGLDYYKSGRAKTYEDAYDFLCLKYYGTYEQTPEGVVKTLLPASARPTFRQFYYYCKTNITQEEVDAIKTSRQEQRNNKRLLLSDSLKGINGPWDCFEMDEVEVDLSLVSVDDPTKVVGRPIVYLMLDVYTRMIAAVPIAFDNNSVLGFTNCIMNLLDDKVEFCKKYGLSISADIWPSGYLPRRIRCDRGAEYRSNRVKNICNELGISRDLVTAGTGSLKGSVEQFFHMMQAAQNPDLENKGLIEKRFDSMHHKEACLNINDFTKIFLNYVVTYNQHYMKNYPLTKDMAAQGTRPIPYEIWKYGIKAFGNPRVILNEEQFYYALMTPINAKISRVGITFQDLYYINYKDKKLLHTMYVSGNKKVPFESRMDERDISRIYYYDDGKLKSASLNSERTGNTEYAGLTYAEYLALRKEKKQRDSQGTEHNRKLRVARKELNEVVLDSVEVRTKDFDHEKPKTEEIRKNRRIEQQIASSNNAIESKLTLTAAEMESNPWQNSTASDFESDIDNWDDALALFD